MSQVTELTARKSLPEELLVISLSGGGLSNRPQEILRLRFSRLSRIARITPARSLSKGEACRDIHRRAHAGMALACWDTCMAYVDLNPVRAGLATAPEEAQFTSIRERLLSAARGETAVPGLLPFSDQAGPQQESLPGAFVDYVEIVRFAAHSISAKATMLVPTDIATRLERHGLESKTFIDTLHNYPRRFFAMVGHAHRIDTESTRRGYKRRPGIRAARRMYRHTG
jgi:hypothetical protein